LCCALGLPASDLMLASALPACVRQTRASEAAELLPTLVVSCGLSVGCALGAADHDMAHQSAITSDTNGYTDAQHAPAGSEDQLLRQDTALFAQRLVADLSGQGGQSPDDARGAGSGPRLTLITNGLDNHRQALSSQQTEALGADAEPQLAPAGSGMPGKSASDAQREAELAAGDANVQPPPNADSAGNSSDSTGADTFRKAALPGLHA